MEVSTLQLPPGDPGLIDKIVCQLKSNGIFDQFRKECIADVDTKPAYQNLRQRVEGSVSSFLSNQEWKPDLNKNQLRDSLRKNIHESGFLDIGVERIVDQVVNPKIYTVFFPKVEDVVYGYLGVEKPKKGVDIPNGLRENAAKFDEPPKQEKKFVSLKDLLPTDLDPISPEKFDSDEDIEENSPDGLKESNISIFDHNSTQKIKLNSEEVTSDIEHDHDEDERDDEDDDDEEDSPPFESLENDALDPNASPPILPLHSADMLDNITSSSSSSETKDLLQYGEVRKRYHELKSDSLKIEENGEEEKYLHSESFKPEAGSENFTPKKEEREKKENLETGKDWKKFDKKEEKNKDNSERKDEVRSKKSSDTKDKHGHEKRRSDKDQVIIKTEKDDSKRSEKEELRKTFKDEHRKSDKDEYKKSEKDEHRKSEKEEHKKGNKDEHRKSEKGDHKRTEKDEHRKSEREEMKKDEGRKSEKGDRKHGEKVDKDRDSSRRHDKEKEDRKPTKEKDEKDKKHVREKEESKRGEKDDYRKLEKEKDDKGKTDRERSDSKKRDKKDEKKMEKEDKKVSKEKDDSKKSDKEDMKRLEKEENSKKLDREKEKHRSSKEKTDHGKNDKETKERVKFEHKDKEVKHGSSKPGTESSKKENNEKDHHSKLQVDKKKEDKAKKSHHLDSSKSNSSKDKKVVDKEKKVSNSDDHRHEKVKGKDGHRRSDRDKDRERERSQADSAAYTALGKDGGGLSSSTSSTPSSDGSKGNGDSSSGSGGSERAKEGETKVKSTEMKEETNDKKINEVHLPISNSPGNLAMKIKKPKIAANIYEVKKIMQVRKNLKKLERERMASSYANKVSSSITDEAPVESASRLEDLSETETISEPPEVKRAKLGAVEQDLRIEVESVLEKGLLDDEDGNIGEVHYLENDSNLNDFVLYVRGLEEDAAMGDYSRVPSPTNSITTAELSDFEDNVILSDVELSKEEEDVVTRLGGLVERKSSNLKSPKKTSVPQSSIEISSEGCNKRPRRPNPRYSSGEFTVYSDDDDDDVDDDMMETITEKKGTLVDGVDIEQRKTPKEKESGEDDTDAIGNGAALPTPENDAGLEERETPVLSKRNQGAVEERRKFGKRLGVRGPLRRFAGFSPGTPDNFVMPLSPESDVSTASGDAGKKASISTKALENQYHQDVDGELGPEDFDDVKGSEDVDKHSRLPLGPPLSGDGRSHASELHHVHNDMGQSSSVLMDGDKRVDDQPGLVSRRLRGTRSSVRVQQRYSSDDLYKPRPNITLGRRNRGRNSPTQGWNEFSTNEESSTQDSAFLKQGRRGSSQGTEELLTESCPPNKRRRR
ncbi:hypothetical protein J437_LFUL003391 [Ladona fulva]|uniref:BOD1/SHG1 domain-containing protein n=1 Tax=Ladona fulva TaxID=123851 RepID=A0A8K0K2M0_LADFU|nr:hypothetical protein J437_LFUL003391 [Ladona fulva]